MAREPNDREDLLREAVGLPNRVEFQLASFTEPVVIGFRSNGAASLFVGQDENYQFNSDRHLRRAFWHGELIKAEHGKLIGLNREARSSETVLVRRELTNLQTQQLLHRLRSRIDDLLTAISTDGFTILGQVSSDGQDVIEMSREWLPQLVDPISIARRPHVR